ncbi:MAG: class I SAM-dependent methyltransferase [bacterium]|nr:class I SAM-dependent methyltransferase [bacterium]
MQRIIEELVEKRKQKQAKLKGTLQSLARLMHRQGFFKSLFNKNKNDIDEKLLELNDDFNQLITIQDKEWDAYSNNHSTMVFKSLEWKISKLEAEYSNVKTLLSNFITLEKSLERLIDAVDTKANGVTGKGIDTAEIAEGLKDIKDQLSVCQYSDFEQRFRGDEEKVKEKLKRYLSLYSETDHILDIGCGRGEFMELLINENKNTEGIDLSQSMLRAAQEKGLNCTHTDALSYLQKKPDASLGGIFSAQVIEHLEPDYLREVVLHAFRVLKPGSPILLETVNPLSLFALSNIYFLDVTHVKPLHPEFMRYLVESCGFSDVGIIYPEQLEDEQLEAISPENGLAREFNTNVDKLNKLLYSSPVYAVTGTKK